MARHREIHNLGADDMYDYDDDYEYYEEDPYSAPASKTDIGNTTNSGAKTSSGGSKKRKKKKQTGVAKQEEKVEVGQKYTTKVSTR